MALGKLAPKSFAQGGHVQNSAPEELNKLKSTIMKSTLVVDDVNFSLKFNKLKLGLGDLTIPHVNKMVKDMHQCCRELIDQGKMVKALYPRVKKEVV